MGAKPVLEPREKQNRRAQYVIIIKLYQDCFIRFNCVPNIMRYNQPYLRVGWEHSEAKNNKY